MRGESAGRKKRSRTRKAVVSQCETGGSSRARRETGGPSRSADSDQFPSCVGQAPRSVKTAPSKNTRSKTTCVKALGTETRCQAGHRGDQDAHDTAAAETALPEAHALGGAAR
jgi:hypothetical protein